MEKDVYFRFTDRELEFLSLSTEIYASENVEFQEICDFAEKIKRGIEKNSMTEDPKSKIREVNTVDILDDIIFCKAQLLNMKLISRQLSTMINDLNYSIRLSSEDERILDILREEVEGIKRKFELFQPIDNNIPF